MDVAWALGVGSWELTRRRVLHGRRNRLDMVGGGSAAAADDVHEAAGREVLDELARFGGQLVVLAEGVRQTGVGIARDVALGDAREVGEVRTHVARAEGAVDPDAERVRVA